MHANPLKRRRVAHLKDWPWSSWSYYEKGERGLITIDIHQGGKKPNQEGEVKARTLEKHKG